MATEKRLIDANAILLKLKSHHDLFINEWEGFSALSEKDKARVDEITQCMADIFNAPTVDAVEVLRCKDCKNRDPLTKECKHPRAVGWDVIIPEDDDFCSYGERKDNG